MNIYYVCAVWNTGTGVSWDTVSPTAAQTQNILSKNKYQMEIVVLLFWLDSSTTAASKQNNA